MVLESNLKLNIFFAPVKMCKWWNWQHDDRFIEKHFLHHLQGRSDLWSNHPWVFNRIHLNLIKKKNKWQYGFINRTCLTFSLIYLFQHIMSLNSQKRGGKFSRVWILKILAAKLLPEVSSWVLAHVCIQRANLSSLARPSAFSLGFNYFTYILIQVTHKA